MYLFYSRAQCCVAITHFVGVKKIISRIFVFIKHFWYEFIKARTSSRILTVPVLKHG